MDPWVQIQLPDSPAGTLTQRFPSLSEEAARHREVTQLTKVTQHMVGEGRRQLGFQFGHSEPRAHAHHYLCSSQGTVSDTHGSSLMLQ